MGEQSSCDLQKKKKIVQPLKKYEPYPDLGGQTDWKVIPSFGVLKSKCPPSDYWWLGPVVRTHRRHRKTANTWMCSYSVATPRPARQTAKQEWQQIKDKRPVSLLANEDLRENSGSSLKPTVITVLFWDAAGDLEWSVPTEQLGMVPSGCQVSSRVFSHSYIQDLQKKIRMQCGKYSEILKKKP